MATTKNKANDVAQEASVLEASEAAVATSADPWKQEVEILLPKGVNGEPNYQIASVNGRVFKIKRGVAVKVPAPIAEVLQNSMTAQTEADEFIEAATGGDE